ncbi:hypothetical protein CCUS01_14401, partial [Colletotrichum cuscutae]
ALYRTTINTLFPWLSTYFESLIPGSFAPGFNAGRETDEQRLSTEAHHWASAGPSDTRRADADAESSATCNMRTETGLMQQKQEEDACHSAMAPSATDAAMIGMSGCFSLQNPSFYLALAFTTASIPIPTCGLSSDSQWHSEGTPFITRPHVHSHHAPADPSNPSNPSIKVSSISKAVYSRV